MTIILPDKSFKTAISRRSPSSPTRWLSENGLLIGRCLDFGCGKGFDTDYFGMVGYDPYYRPQFPDGEFDTIICIYVLNVLSSFEERDEVLRSVVQLLKPDGVAYFAVRRDLKKSGFTSKGTYQGIVNLNLIVIHKTSHYLIYQADRECKYGIT
jgi:hypothetical protein